jgi:hypothetical protein
MYLLMEIKCLDIKYHMKCINSIQYNSKVRAMVKTFTVLKTFKTSKVIQYKKYYEMFEYLQAHNASYHFGQR